MYHRICYASDTMTDIDHLSGENFFDILDNGAVLCRLANVIQEKAQLAIDAGRAKGPTPIIGGHCWDNAARRSFFSRDNMENFIQFCRRLGVHENLLFESDDLGLSIKSYLFYVSDDYWLHPGEEIESARFYEKLIFLHGQPRNVVLCLLEVARLATKYSLEPPGLVQLEREIATEQEKDLHCMTDSDISQNNLVSWQFQSPSTSILPRSNVDKMNHSSSAIEMSTSVSYWLPVTTLTHEPAIRRPISDNGPMGSDSIPSDTTENDWSRGSTKDPDEILSSFSSPSPSSIESSAHRKPLKELDKKL